MNMQALLIRATVFVVLCLGLAIATIQRGPATAQMTQTPSVHPFTAPAPKARIEVVVLPTVTVRPTTADRAIAVRAVAVAVPRANSSGDNRVIYAVGALALPNLRMDMPYFSFGKVLPRVSKE